MSHLVEIATEVRDPAAVQLASARLHLEQPTCGTARLYSGEAGGLLVELPGWKYPLVCDTDSGTMRFDNFGGRWGAQQELDRFLQAYAIEKAKLEARRSGHTVTEQPLQDGSVRLTVQLGGSQ